ncbi:hypothetical protein ACFSE1_09695 [Rhizobium helianthi]|uniref:Type III effector HrpK n=1 Tax=Rhizobium helianthi TaxID=1132695 RepID=A0ABW4M2Q1_9HYPH
MVNSVGIAARKTEAPRPEKQPPAPAAANSSHKQNAGGSQPASAGAAKGAATQKVSPFAANDKSAAKPRERKDAAPKADAKGTAAAKPAEGKAAKGTEVADSAASTKNAKGTEAAAKPTQAKDTETKATGAKGAAADKPVDGKDAASKADAKDTAATKPAEGKAAKGTEVADSGASTKNAKGTEAAAKPTQAKGTETKATDAKGTAADKPVDGNDVAPSADAKDTAAAEPAEGKAAKATEVADSGASTKGAKPAEAKADPKSAESKGSEAATAKPAETKTFEARYPKETDAKTALKSDKTDAKAADAKVDEKTVDGKSGDEMTASEASKGSKASKEALDTKAKENLKSDVTARGEVQAQQLAESKAVQGDGGKQRYINYDGLKDVPRNTAPPKDYRYGGLNENDKLVMQYMNRDREAMDKVGPLPDVSAYQNKVQTDPITKSDVLESQHWQRIGIASETFESDAKQLDNQKFSLLKDSLAGVDRGFVNPDNYKNLGSLNAEQKSALLVDLVELKQNFNAYDNNYGDSVPGIDKVGQNIDDRINTLMGDADTRTHVNMMAGKAIQDYVARPENGDLQHRLKTAYLDDIVGGKALDRELQKGKSFDEAVQAYNSELTTLTEALPSDFVRLKMNVATATLSQRVQDHYLGDGTPGDLTPFAADEKGNSAALKPAADALALQFMGQNADNAKMNQVALKVNYAQDITRDANAVINLMRGGMKLDDAITGLRNSVGERTAPVGVDGDAYKAGVIHGAQALAMSSVLVSRSLQPGKAWTPDEIAASVGQGVQITGMVTEGLAKNLDAAGKRFSAFGTTDGTFGKALSSVVNAKNLEAGGKILGAAGGAAMAGLSFYSASRSIKQGEPVKGALEIISGTAGAASAAIGFTEGMVHLTNAIPRLFHAAGVTADVASMASGAFKSVMATGGVVAGAVGALAGFGLGLYDMIKGVQKLDKMEVKLNEKLAKYTGDEVNFEFRPKL